jgi:hypothetical protein
MLMACEFTFENLYSIELSATLHQRAQLRLRAMTNLRLMCGDSGQLLPQICSQAIWPALFWLDGHFSGGETAQGASDTPIWGELRAIAATPAFQGVVLIDDARCFDGSGDYPALDDLLRWASIELGWDAVVSHDIIFLGDRSLQLPVTIADLSQSAEANG